MPPVREPLEQVARRLSDEARARSTTEQEQLVRATRSAAEIPRAFFMLADRIRDAVRRFNAASDPQGRLLYSESAALATRELHPNGEFHLELVHGTSSAVLTLKAMVRAGKPDAFIIEGFGQLGRERFGLRVDGAIQNNRLVLRTSVDRRRIECDLGELAERLVLAAALGDYQKLLA